MGKTNVVVEVKVPLAKSYSFVKESVANPKFMAIYRYLHPGKEYSGKIVDDIENRRLVIEESGIDSLTRIRHKGWTITYDFEETDDKNTKVSISVEYGIFLAIMGLTTTKLQSINEVLARVNSILALEQV